MFRFENPLDPSKDGMNPFIDGIRYNIRNSEMIKEEILSNLNLIIYQAREYGIENSLEILESAVNSAGYDLDELTIADEHELLDKIQSEISWLG